MFVFVEPRGLHTLLGLGRLEIWVGLTFSVENVSFKCVSLVRN